MNEEEVARSDGRASRRRVLQAGTAATVGAVVWAEPSIRGLARRPAYAAAGSGASSVTIQAETGTTVGGAFVGTTHSGWTGTGYVQDIIAVNAGVTGLTLTGATAGAAQLSIRYAAGIEVLSPPAGTMRTITLRVNGGAATQLSYADTGSWSTYDTIGPFPITLVAGTNTIDLVYESGDTGWIDIDFITVTC